MLPEIKLTPVESNQADNQQLQTLIDKYGVNGIMRQMANMMLDNSENADSDEENKALDELADVLFQGGDKAQVIGQRMRINSLTSDNK